MNSGKIHPHVFWEIHLDILKSLSAFTFPSLVMIEGQGHLLTLELTLSGNEWTFLKLEEPEAADPDE